MNLGWQSGNNKQDMYFVFAIKTRHMSISRDNSKITRKEMLKLFLCDYNHYDIVKCPLKVIFEEIDTEPSARKNNEFWQQGYLRIMSSKILLEQC